MTVSAVPEPAAEPPPSVDIDASSRLRSPRTVLTAFFSDLSRSGFLSVTIFRRDLAAQYRGMILGGLWIFIQPVIASLVFVALVDAGVLALGETDLPYPLYVYAGTLLWQVFRLSIDVPRQAMSQGKSLLNRLNFPIEGMILAKVYRVLMTAGFSVLTLAIAIAVFLDVGHLVNLLWYPVVILPLMILGLLVGGLAAPLENLFGDFSFFMTYAIGGLFLLTPVVYSAPESGVLAILVAWNPLTYVLGAGRALVTGSSVADLGLTVALVLASVVLLAAVHLLYRITLPFIVERSGA